MNQTLNRFGLIKKLSAHHEAGLLFAYVQSDSAKEYRPTLQYTYKFAKDSTLYSIRNRLDFRDVEQQQANSMRWRSLFRWAKPIAHSWGLLIWEEIKIEFGYLNQLIPRQIKTIQEHTLVGYFYF